MISSIRILLTGMSRMFSVHIIIIHRYVLEKYYTDWQDVDEDARTIADHGGSWGFGWSSGDTPGVFLRNMTNSSAISGNTVASKIMHNLLFY